MAITETYKDLCVERWTRILFSALAPAHHS